jgi:23S rRNA-/tRNA-specific pseudouridylate synthase
MLERLALHAAGIQFDHPSSGAPLSIEAPLPDELRVFIEQRRA